MPTCVAAAPGVCGVAASVPFYVQLLSFPIYFYFCASLLIWPLLCSHVFLRLFVAEELFLAPLLQFFDLGVRGSSLTWLVSRRCSLDFCLMPVLAPLLLSHQFIKKCTRKSAVLTAASVKCSS